MPNRVVRAAPLAAFLFPWGCAPAPREPSSARVESPVTQPAAAIEGEVDGPTGEPVVGALVSAWSHFNLDLPDPTHDEITDMRGRFRFAALAPGRYAVTATLPGKTAAYSGGVVVAATSTTPHVSLRMVGASMTFKGSVRDETGAPAAGTRMMAASDGDKENEVYVTRADAEGRYSFTLPAQPLFYVVADAPPRPRAYVPVRPDSPRVDLTLGHPPAPRPSDAAIVAWLRARATPLAATGDLNPVQTRAFEAIVGDAPLVAMGEATHGSAEFPDWRRKVFEALVRDEGFTVYAVEVGFPDALALDDYVVNGKGDPVRAIHALNTWKDETTETLALVKWMREYNADPKHPRKVHFEGFDVYTPSAIPLILAFLTKADPAAADESREALALFAGVGCDSTYPALPEDTRARARKRLDALLVRFDAKHAAYAAATSEEEWTRARQLVRVVQEAETSYSDTFARDAQMAENVGWLVRQHAGGTKVLLDAHNSHISAVRAQLNDMGQRLRREWGDRYVAIGFAFGEGSFLARDWSHGTQSSAFVPLTIGHAAPDTFDGAMSLAKLPAFVVDLRTADVSVRAWLRSPERMHSIGAQFWGDDGCATLAPSRSFDAVIYVDRVSAIHPLPAAK